jgi:Zn-finger nucleic acid-binding protein
MSNREGIEIDYCSQCRGVWLDRGELDKIIERSAGDMPARPYRDDDDDDWKRRDPEYRRHKPKHILKELFDF